MSKITQLSNSVEFGFYLKWNRLKTIQKKRAILLLIVN